MELKFQFVLIRKLMEIYSQLSMDAKFSEMKSKLSELEN